MPPFCEEHDMYHDRMGEHGAMRRAEHARQREARRQQRAEQIAQAEIDAYAEVVDHDDRPDFLARASQWRDIITAAALQALTETENTK